MDENHVDSPLLIDTLLPRREMHLVGRSAREQSSRRSSQASGQVPLGRG